MLPVAGSVIKREASAILMAMIVAEPRVPCILSTKSGAMLAKNGIKVAMSLDIVSAAALSRAPNGVPVMLAMPCST